MARTQRSRNLDLGRPEITELEFGQTTHRVATVEPMDLDGVRTMTVGTVVWGVIALALLPFWANLQDSGRTWWLWTAIAGLGLGLMGIEYCKRRRDALAQNATPEANVAAPAAAKPVAPQATVQPDAPKPAAAKPEAPKLAAPEPVARRRAVPERTDAPRVEVDPPVPTDRPVGRRRRT